MISVQRESLDAVAAAVVAAAAARWRHVGRITQHTGHRHVRSHALIPARVRRAGQQVYSTPTPTSMPVNPF